jgi:Fic-DOC domain mobile mystery protein B
MGLDLDYINGQTPLDEEEKEGLLIPSISNRAELDEFEQQNIEEAIQWIMGRSFSPELAFSVDFVRTVHKKMFGDVWSWAGEFRKSNKNLGIYRWQIPTELKYLIDDCRYWYDNNVFSPDELSIRFKHRIVSIHFFANGNGRHSRLMADIIIEKIYKLPLFSWGEDSLSKETDSRKAYLKAVKAADNGDFSLLIDFARS